MRSYEYVWILTNWMLKPKRIHFPLPFLDYVMDFVVGHEMYSFMDGYIVVIIRLKWKKKTKTKQHSF
jgi:hypothetical protein